MVSRDSCCWIVVFFIWAERNFFFFSTVEGRVVNDDVPECRIVAGVGPDGNKTRELLCLHGLPNLWYIESPETVSVLTVLKWRDEVLDAAAVTRTLPRLRRLCILNGNLNRIVTAFPVEARFLEVIEISGTELHTLSGRLFSDLPALHTLDLRNNALSHIEPKDLEAGPALRKVYLAGNQWACNKHSAWLVNKTYGSLVERITDRSELRCWMPFKGRPLLFVMEIIQRLQEECRQLSVCECELVYVVNGAANGSGSINSVSGNSAGSASNNGGVVQQTRQQRQFMAFASVNCSHRGFTEMPSFLPANTTTLHLEGNKISDLTPLKSNPAYRTVIDLYLDDNEVESIGLLDGTDWLEHFRLFSLRGNKMADFATYVLENVLSHSQTAVSLYLGNNPWRCDCQITPGFQEFLIKYGYLIKDISDVRCSAENRDYANRQIQELTRTEICVIPEEPILYPIDVINIILILMIFSVFIKLTYDYWIFKKSGKLPWLVNMLP